MEIDVLLLVTAGWVQSWDSEKGPRDSRDECQDENSGGTASGLPEAYSCAQRVFMCQGGTLQHVASGCEYNNHYCKHSSPLPLQQFP